ncbi:unnamed protein product [Gemmata massiliana]|uniref:Zinc finger/thioredoxin putative domain-containing protein n=1 Tax=Gemmata massiliana TaxID=1210884 RepID=A0A6P2D402_9BACT|nr:MJ0042-type zinc finger domain-containing protein [Gemmata massiliana]VTR94834.1 unnamed protein product [Gemmata massiliana]
MAVSIYCPHCQHQFKIPETAIGKKGRCPACKQVLTAEFPAVASYEVVEKPEIVEPEAQPIADEVSEPAPVRPRSRDGDEEPEVRPGRKPRKVRPASQGFLRLTVLFGGLAAAVACGVIFYLWQREQTELSGYVALVEAFRGAQASPEITKEMEILTARRKAYPSCCWPRARGWSAGCSGPLGSALLVGSSCSRP